MRKGKKKNEPKVIEVYSQPLERVVASGYPGKRGKRVCIHVWYVLLQFNPRARPVRLRISAQAARWLMRVKRLNLRDVKVGRPCYEPSMRKRAT